MIDALLSPRETPLTRVIRFVRTNGLTFLNIGGLRESEDPVIYQATGAFLFVLFSPCWSLIITATQPWSGANSP